jgi:sortase (surface protein transpeptidase)
VGIRIATPRRRTAWWAVCAVAALVPATVLGGWWLSRPGDSAGQDLATVRAAGAPASAGPSVDRSPDPAPDPSAAPTAQPLVPQPRVRDASLEALQSAVAPAPSRLVIPDLGVDAVVEPVGVQPDGAMVIPASPTSVGWYRYGPAPADPEGNTVIAGHVATREDGPGALADLREASPGMRVEVTGADGTVHAYEVVGREAIVKQSLPVDDIFARDGRPLLVLITCGGEYIPELRTHRDNIVVTAVPVS